MTEFTNPFYSLVTAMSVLESVGADPVDNLPEGDAECCDWREHILSVCVRKAYEGSKNYFTVEIHMEGCGFDALMDIVRASNKSRLLDSLKRVKHSDPYDEVSVYLDRGGYLFKVMKLVPVEVE